MPKRKAKPARSPGGRAFRGLVLTFFLSFLNLAGLLLTVTALGLEGWTGWQFAGLFGVVEAASGLANVYLPNVWRLPVAELQTSERTATRLAASTVLIPHWGAAGRFLAGLGLLAAAIWHEGIGPATLSIPPALLLLALLMLLVSSIAARAGVARPDLDVFQFVVRWRNEEKELPPISITASVLQFTLSILTIPVASLIDPGLLYRPELGLAWQSLAALVLLTALLGAATALAWRSRIDLRAPPEQEREASRNA